jgi:hypothetical protein
MSWSHDGSSVQDLPALMDAAGASLSSACARYTADSGGKVKGMAGAACLRRWHGSCANPTCAGRHFLPEN